MADDSVAQDQLRAFIERIERMEEEKAAIAADIKEIYAEAKGNGFDAKILRKIVSIRKQDANERLEQEALLDLYMGALGMAAAPADDYEHRGNSDLDISGIDPQLLVTLIEGSKTEAGRQIIRNALEAVNAPQKPKTGPVARAQEIVEQSEASGVKWVRSSDPEPTRHAYSKAFGVLGQDIHVIQDDIEGAKSEPVVMLGDEVLDGWARSLAAQRTIGLDGMSAFYPVVQYEGKDPLIDCIKLNVAGRMMSEGERLSVAAVLAKANPKRKADIYAAFELGMELA